MSSHPSLRSSRARCAIVGCAAVFLMCIGPKATLRACDTPVYRYAMYRWEPTPYEVYHFHRGEVGAAFTAASDEIFNANSDQVSPANVAVYPVSLDDDPELKTIPRDVRRLWEAKVEQGVKAPLTVIVNPKGYEVFAGDLGGKEIAALVNSPSRTQIGEHLKKGHAGVYILLPGKDDELNRAAEEAVAKLVKDVNDGKLQLYAGPQLYNPLDPKFELPVEKSGGDGEESEATDEEDSPKEDADKKPPHSAVSMKLTRDQLDADDPWLYRSLMAVENDLHEFQDEPMLFVVYGRGRALPPYIGKGIVYSNLVEITDFITSACSCTVKDQNPGVDLLMAYDWQSASAALVEKFGSEEGNNESLTDLFPQLIVPGGGSAVANDKPASEVGDTDAGGETTTVANSADTVSVPSDEPKQTDNDPDGDNSSAVPADQTSAKDATPSEPADVADKESDPASADSGKVVEADTTVALAPSAAADRAAGRDVERAGGSNLMVTLGIGMGVAFLALLAATFLILKPQ